MDDGFLMGVLHSFTGLDEQFQAFANLESLLIAICR